MSEVFSDNEGVFKAYKLRNQTNIINSDQKNDHTAYGNLVDDNEESADFMMKNQKPLEKQVDMT